MVTSRHNFVDFFFERGGVGNLGIEVLGLKGGIKSRSDLPVDL